MSKKTILILAVFLSVTIAKSQTYESIVDTTKMWVIYESSAYELILGKTVAYKIANDSTFIDDRYWYKVLKAEDSTYTQWSFFSYINEEDKVISLNGSFAGFGSPLYDFNLIAGDSLCCTPENVMCMEIEDSYESFFADKNRYTQTLVDDIIYEGIGSKSRGLLHFYDYVGVSRTLVCYFHNGELLYKHPSLENCYQNDYPSNINVNTINRMNNLIIYPNPTSEMIHIPDVSPQSHYLIYDVYGKEICTGKLNNNNDVNVSDLHSGLYYIRITLNHENYSGKFIVK